MRAAANAKWMVSLTIELRLLDVDGTRIGDAVASAREFLGDSGTPAEEFFGTPRHYAAQLNLPAVPVAAKAVHGAVLRSGLGVFGLFAIIEAVLPLVRHDAVTLGIGELVIYAAILLAIMLLPQLVPFIVRMRRRGTIVSIVIAAVLGGSVPFLFSMWSAQSVVLRASALPVFIGGAVLLIGPALWTQIRNSLADDPIVEPRLTRPPHDSLGTRIFLFATNWLLVLCALIICAFVLWANTVPR